MRQKTINIYKFNELDPDVQETEVENAGSGCVCSSGWSSNLVRVAVY